MEKETAFSAVIKGRVQGVGFRYSCLNEARRLGLSGWVKNTRDGNVEVWSEGSEKTQKEFLKWLQKGPSYARVDSVQTTSRSPTGSYHDFSIHY